MKYFKLIVFLNKKKCVKMFCVDNVNVYNHVNLSFNSTVVEIN